jgi:hypothetical protein
LPAVRLQDPPFSDEGGKDYHIAEIAHIFAALDDGPRANPAVDHKERAAYQNLILLCPNCHTEVDKAPELFPDAVIRQWKASHKEEIQKALGIVMLKTREEARARIEPFLRTNRAIFEALNPNKNYRENPEAEEALVWKRKMKADIIPNSKTVLMLLDVNRALLKPEEMHTVEQFRQHVSDMIERHLGENASVASRFPDGMNQLLA